MGQEKRMNPPEFLIHIGQHKTGSKALQFFCAKHARPLRQRGVLYEVDGRYSQGIRAYAVSHHRLFALLRREAMEDAGDHEAADGFWREFGSFCQPWNSSVEMLRHLAQQRIEAGADTVLVSAEDLFDMHTAHELEFRPDRIQRAAKRLAEGIAAAGGTARLVVYLRRQDHLLGAHYAQFIKGSARNDLDFPDFAGAFAPRLHAHRILEMWSAVFGEQNMTVRAYEPESLRGGIVADFFDHVLGFTPPPEWAPPERDAETANVTPDRPHIEFLRLLNRRSCQGLSGLSREAVLESALLSPPGRGVAEWMTGGERRNLLEAYRAENAAIARTFLQREDGQLFVEEMPDAQAGCEELKELTPERAVDIAVRVHELDASRIEAGPRAASSRWWVFVVLAAVAMAALLVLLWLR